MNSEYVREVLREMLLRAADALLEVDEQVGRARRDDDPCPEPGLSLVPPAG